MNWDAISAIAEVLGAVAVVGSLVYVGRQVAHNTAMMRVAAASETLEIDHELVLPLIDDKDFMEVWLKGDHRLNELDEADLNRVLIFERRAITLWYYNFQLHRQKFLSDELWAHQSQMIRILGRREAMREAWGMWKESHEIEFQQYVDDQFQIANDSLSE
jgi:hypothetical protein